MPVNYTTLTQSQRDHFLEHGWIKIAGGIPAENVEKFVGNDYCPEAYKAACDLVGGEDRLDPKMFTQCGDSLILNFGSADQPEDGKEDPRELVDWHIDGDWFNHYLDSGEQGLVVLHLYTDVYPDGCGATMVCEDGIKKMCDYLRENPQGTNMRDGKGGNAYEAIKGCQKFTELHGKAGDVFLAHPFMPHSRTANFKRHFRAITNPPCTLKQPLNLNREDPSDYSLVELKILGDLGVDRLPDWHITTERRRFPPHSQATKGQRIKAELERMQEHAKKHGGKVESMHLDEDGRVLE